MLNLRRRCFRLPLLLCFLPLLVPLCFTQGTPAKPFHKANQRQDQLRYFETLQSIPTRKRRSTTPPGPNWERDQCTEMVPSTCKDIGMAAAVTAGSAVVMACLVYWRKRDVGVRNGKGDLRSLK